MCLWLNTWSHPFHSIFCFLAAWEAVLPRYLPNFPSSFSLSSPTSLQITVSLAQGYEQTSSSPKPRFKSYAYTQAAYVATSDSTRSPFPSQVCSHLLSLLHTREILPKWSNLTLACMRSSVLFSLPQIRSIVPAVIRFPHIICCIELYLSLINTDSSLRGSSHNSNFICLI